MNEKLLNPDYVFETSWEVCNKIGGIYTVVSTKALTLLSKYNDNLITIGPDVWRFTDNNPDFIEDTSLFRTWRKWAAKNDLKVRIGRWNIVGKPIVFLVDYSTFISEKDEILKSLWEEYQLDSISGQWDYIEPAIFGYAAGKVIESFSKFNLTIRDKVVAHFHEWMTGAGVLHLKTNAPYIGTVFTTHATVVGRSISGNGLPLYGKLTEYDGDLKAKEFGLVSKQSLEKNSAKNADAFTTVSQITALECKQFLEKQVDIVTPNGFEDNFVPQKEELVELAKKARAKSLQVAEALLGYKLQENTILIGTSGRYEYRNKGIDVFIDAMAEINKRTDFDKQILAFLYIPANNYGYRKNLQEKIENPEIELIQNSIFDKYLTHGLHDAEYDSIIKRLRETGLENLPHNKVKVIFVPSYLNGNDGIFNMSYYDLLSGLDLTLFPSYYEPWGYTPLESLAFHVPTITTSLAGFGKWISNQLNDTDCIFVAERNDDNYQETVQVIAAKIISCSKKTEIERQHIRENAYFISKNTLWKNMIKYYYQAFHIALEKVNGRAPHFEKIVQTHRVVEVKRYKVNKPAWSEIVVQPNLTKQFSGLEELSKNLWWSWNYEAQELFEMLDAVEWEKCEHNPIQLLKAVSYERLIELEADWQFINKYNYVYNKFSLYMKAGETKKGPAIGYFSMEFGIHDSLKIFSGGLGILAGDYLKEASDCNVNMVGVGFLYRYGYFKQQLSLNGEQLVAYEPQDFAKLPVSPAKDANDEEIVIQVALPGRIVSAKVWKAEVGRITLLLLDTDITKNQKQDRTISHQLYGGDWENRLKQEMLLGVGGIRAFEKLNIRRDIFHCNEGHAAFIGLERLNILINNFNYTFAESLEIVRASTLFTTHTPVPAGHDSFTENLIMAYMGHYPERLKISWQEFIELGKMFPQNQDEKFSMSCLAANLSQEVNGVSYLHGEVTKNMFQNLWEGYFPQELHIGYVTNGVHMPSWTAKEWRIFYEETFGKEFLNDQSNKKYWGKIHNVPDEKIWNIRLSQRKRLIDEIKNRLNTTWVRRRVDPKQVMGVKNTISENKLTIGFARRFATYKRAYLLFKNLDRLSNIVNNPKMPVQFIFAGKAHPQDGGGQDMIRHIVEISNRPEFLGKIVFLENYDISLAKKLVRGVDIWLNTPTRPLEASGTSGMKAVMNGVLNFSVLDGWWVEGYKEEAGWALPQERSYDNQEFQDELDAETIYRTLEYEIIPKFYERNKAGIPVEWVKYIKNCIAEIAPEFTTKRMIDDYIERFYNKLAKRTELMKENDCELAKNIASWKKKVSRGWDSIEVVKINFSDPIKEPLVLGEEYFGEIILDLHELSNTSIGVEMLIGDLQTDGKMKIVKVNELRLMKTSGSLAHYGIELRPSTPGVYSYGFRIFPKNELLPHRQDFNYVRWL